MRRIFSFSGAMASVCVVVVLIAWSARADDSVKLNRLLKGDYAFTSTRACSSVIYNFFPSGTPNVPDNGNAFTAFPDLNLRGSSTSNTFIDRAIMRYDGKGNVTLVDGRTFLIVDQVTGVGQSQVRSNVFTCTGVYQVNPDRSFTQQISCAIQRIAGVFVGEVFTPATGFQMEGQIGPGGQTLVLSDTSTDIEDLTSDVRGRFQQICGRSGFAVKIIRGAAAE